MNYRTLTLTVLVAALAAAAGYADLVETAKPVSPEEQLKSRITEGTQGFSDIKMDVTVTQKDKKALTRVESSYSRLYDFKSATIYVKQPDKMRTEGRLGMIRFEYIINGSDKIVRAPTINFNKREKYPDEPAKVQDALDTGLITPSLWRTRSIQIVDDAEAAAAGEIKVRYSYPAGDMQYLIWLDEKDLWLKRFEKRQADGTLEVRFVYSNPQRFGEVIWMPTRTEMYAADGAKAGTLESSKVEVNINPPDTMFQ